MKHSLGQVVALLLTAVAAVRAQATPPASVALRNATVIDVRTGQLHPGYTVVVTGNRIAVVGPAASVRVPAGARVVDATGKYLIPGLTDTHVHLRWQWERQPADTLAQLGWILANGVTSVRDMSARGYERLAALRAANDSGRILSPRIYISAQPWGELLQRLETTGRVAAIQRLHKSGVDGIKVLGLPRDTSLVIIADARAADMPVYGHTFAPDSAGGRIINFTMEAVRAGISGVVHVVAAVFPMRLDHELPMPSLPPTTPEGGKAWELYNWTGWRRIDDHDLQALIDTMVADHTWFEPTLTGANYLVNADRYDRAELLRYFTWLDSEPSIVDPEVRIAVREALAAGKRFLRRFYDAGGTVLAGSDHMPFPPLGVTEELRLLVDAGLPPVAALQAATINAARAMQMDDRLGTVEVGKLADLVLLDANPLADITNVRRVNAVVANGRLLDRARLDQLVARIGTPIQATRPPPPRQPPNPRLQLTGPERLSRRPVSLPVLDGGGFGRPRS